jgi:nitronate monooxygenase
MTVPIVQAPMAGTSTPALAAAVCNAGGLGSVSVGAVGAVGAEEAERMIRAVRLATDRPFNVNVFCHRPVQRNAAHEVAWVARLSSQFRRFGAEPPGSLEEVYSSFVADDSMLATLVRQRPAVVSFHFGLPPAGHVAALRSAGAVLVATATTLAEARAAASAGVDMVVAQGYEAGGHRGVFDPDADDDRLGTLALVRLLVARQPLPVIAAGGIMDGAGVAAACAAGAVAAQLGTAFIGCPESSADAAHRAALRSAANLHTTMTRVISGRPARCLPNEFTRWGRGVADADVPAHPVAYAAGKALHAAAKAAGEFGFGAHWAGQGAPLAREMAAAELVATLADELRAAGH